MRRIVIGLALLLLAVMAFSLTGCGGGGHDTTLSARFSASDTYIEDNGSIFYYDRYEVRAKRDGYATVRINSPDVEPYIEVYFVGGDLVAKSEVNPNTGYAYVRFPVYAGEYYAVWAISNIAGQTGRYDITFSSNLDFLGEASSLSINKTTPREKPAPAQSKDRFRVK